MIITQKNIEKLKKFVRWLEWIQIRVENFTQKIWNAIYNNRVANEIKEIFYRLFGVPYPEYIYTDDLEGGNYIYKITPENPKIGEEVRIMVTDNIGYAIDVSKWSMFKKNRMLNNLNKSFGGARFIFKRVLTYE